MTTDTDFRAALAADPADASLRLVYADWLDEQREWRRAALQRVLARPDDDAPRLAYADVCEREWDWQTASFVRIQVELFRTAAPQHEEWRKGSFQLLIESVHKWYGKEWRPYPDSIYGQLRINHPDGRQYDLIRGFVEQVTCSWADWAQHGDAVCAAQPVRRVVLATRPELPAPLAISPHMPHHADVPIAGRLVHLGERDIMAACDARGRLRDSRPLVAIAVARRWPTVADFEAPA